MTFAWACSSAVIAPLFTINGQGVLALLELLGQDFCDRSIIECIGACGLGQANMICS